MTSRHSVYLMQRYLIQSPSWKQHAWIVTSKFLSVPGPVYSQAHRDISGTARRGIVDKHDAEVPLPSLTQLQAYDMISKLTAQEREQLSEAINRYQSESVKFKLQGELASTNWRLKFGRRDVLPAVDPTGSYCTMPDDWLAKKMVEAATPPSRDDLFRIMLVNSIPFVGFGFLDNFFMILAGDYIEASMGVYMSLSTMAAAGLGNTISDVFGLGLAHYVERFCEFLGLRPPALTPTQMQMKSSQRFASAGRCIGITIGCLLGMFPLYFMKKKPKKGEKDEKDEKTEINAVAVA